MFSAVSGWKLLVELGWTARLWLQAVVYAILLEERAAMSGWDLLTVVLRRTQGIAGGWQHAVAELREKFQVPPFDRAAARLAPSKEARRARLRKYGKEIVEPRVFKRTQQEVAEERRKTENTLYCELHPGRGPVASTLDGHGWGPETMADYRRWARLRLLMRVSGQCPECGALDHTAVHILGHVHARLWAAGAKAPEQVTHLLRTDVPAGELRRNVRAVGQTLRGGADWRWLEAKPPPAQANE